MKNLVLLLAALGVLCGHVTAAETRRPNILWLLAEDVGPEAFSYLTADPYADIAMMVPHAVNWQIKETLDSTTDSPRADFKKLVNIIRDGGYRGFLPIETLSMRRKDYDPAAEVTKVLAQLREAIGNTQ